MFDRKRNSKVRNRDYDFLWMLSADKYGFICSSSAYERLF